MGLLDPKIDKARTFELLKKRDAVKAVLAFQGGHDEGCVESITLTLSTGEEVDLPTWYCGGYTIAPGGKPPYEWVPMSTPQNEDEELADLLEGPVNAEFGSWGGAPSTEGTLTWNVFTEEVSMKYHQETWAEYSDVV